MTYPNHPTTAAYPRLSVPQYGSPQWSPYPAPHQPAPSYPVPYGAPGHRAPAPDAHGGWSAVAVGLALYDAQRHHTGHPALYLLAILVGIAMVVGGVFIALAL